MLSTCSCACMAEVGAIWDHAVADPRALGRYDLQLTLRQIRTARVSSPLTMWGSLKLWKAASEANSLFSSLWRGPSQDSRTCSLRRCAAQVTQARRTSWFPRAPRRAKCRTGDGHHKHFLAGPRLDLRESERKRDPSTHRHTHTHTHPPTHPHTHARTHRHTETHRDTQRHRHRDTHV